MRPSLSALCSLILLITHFTTAVPYEQKQQPHPGDTKIKPAEIPAGSGITYPNGIMSPSNEVSSVARKLIDWDTPLVEGDCLFYDDVPNGPHIEPDNPDSFQDYQLFHVRIPISLQHRN